LLERQACPSGPARRDKEDAVGIWAELLIGMVVMIVLVVGLGAGLWSSRVSISKADDKSQGKDAQSGK
jgi:hypothetical protein